MTRAAQSLLISRCAECSLRITAATEHRPLISHRQRSLAAAQLQSRSTDLACSAAKSCSAARLRWHAPAVVAPALCARGPSERMAPRRQLRLDSRGTMAAVSSLQDCVSPARPSTRTSAVMAPGQSRCRVDGMGGPLVDWMSSNRTVISVSFRLYVLYYTGQFSSVEIRVELNRI